LVRLTKNEKYKKGLNIFSKKTKKNIKKSMENKEYYIVFVVGKQSPTHFHDTKELAEAEAIRLAKKEREITFVFKAVSKFELNDVIKTDLTNQ